MIESPFANQEFEFNTEDLENIDRTIYVLDKLRSKLFLERSKTCIDDNKSLKRQVSSPGLYRDIMVNKRKVYPVRFK